MKNKFMQRAIELSIESINSGGGPFGSVVAKDNEIISEGMNRVTVNNDPTAHGEITAIRQACKKLNTFDLSGYELYSNCEPCPMCLSAIYWSHIDKVYYLFPLLEFFHALNVLNKEDHQIHFLLFF